jgi:uncharacterized beta-barrel protein YwiB (DUF1934 family)
VHQRAIIQVIGTQTNSEGSDDVMEFTTLGTYHIRKGTYYIIYRESEVTGMEGVTTSLKIESDKVTLNRMGEANYKQIYQLGVLHRATYVTPQGSFYLGADTKEMEICLTEHGGHISLKYNLFIDEDFISQNKLRIMIKEEAPQ